MLYEKFDIFLGIHINYIDPNLIKMGQRKFITDSLTKFILNECRPVNTPIDSNV